MSSTASSTKTPTVQVTVGTFDHTFSEAPDFRIARSHPLGAFGRFNDELYTPDNSLREAERHGGGSTPLRDATMEMIHHLDGVRSEGTVTIGLLLDESGSMAPNRMSVIEGVNEFVVGLKDIPASEGGRVLCVIFTDGFENASRNVTPEELRQAVGERENDGWTFIFMGANMDAWNEGRAQMGISGGVRGQSVNFASTPVGTQSAFGETRRRAGSYLKSQESYDVLAASIGNNSSVEEDGTVTSSSTSEPTASPKMPKPGTKKPKPKPKPKPYGDISKAMDTVSETFKKVRGDK